MPPNSLAADSDDNEANSDTMFATLASRLITNANNSGCSNFNNTVMLVWTFYICTLLRFALYIFSIAECLTSDLYGLL